MGGLKFDLNKFDVNAPVFKPTNFKPLEGPCIIEQIAAQQAQETKPEKKSKKKKNDKRTAS